MSSPSWHVQSPAQVLATLGTDRTRGLSQAEAARRLAEEGPNLLPEPEGAGPWILFLGQFKSMVVLVLMAAGLVSGFLGEWVDAIAIFAIVVLNAGIGFYQEYNAEQSIAALRKMAAPSARARREGSLRSLPAAQLVRGDLVEFEAGDLVPADVRVLEAAGLRCVESALTGESLAVDKMPDTLSEATLSLGDRVNMAYLGTSVAAGAGTAVVVGTGLNTEFGRIARLLASAAEDDTTPLQKRLDSLGKTLVWISLGAVAVLFGLGLWRGQEPFELLLTSISLAVAAAPEGLPAVVTVALALGVQRMVRRNALVRRLPAVETLGSATVICTDKTGTLTAGEMTVREQYVAGELFHLEGTGWMPEGRVLQMHQGGREPDSAQLERLRDLAAIQVGTVTASLYQEKDQWKVVGDPTEGAMLAAGRKLGLDEAASDPASRVHAYPFDSDRKRASVIQRSGEGEGRILVNGAPDVLLGLCTRVHTPDGTRDLHSEGRKAILDANAAMASRGLRVIGSAYRECLLQEGRKPKLEDVECDLTFMGLAGMYDPPRPEAREAVTRCKAAGIRVVMITGDHPVTALAIGRDLGIAGKGEEVVTGRELDTLDETALRGRVESIAIYARVSAEHKLRIVNALKDRGAIVAMTGDGVNDAPALKGAHIGVAMGRAGTEVTKQASDMIITDDNFASIVAAVEEGRGIYQNIRNTLQFLLAGNAGEMMLMAVAIIAGLPTPLLAIHLLWINLVTDGLPALCLAAERIDPAVMKKKPQAQAEFLSDKSFRRKLLLTGFLTAGVSLAVFLWARETRGLEEARSFAFTSLVFSELFRSLGARSENQPLWRINPFGNIQLLVVLAISLGLQVLAHQDGILGGILKTQPMAWNEMAMLAGFSLLPLLVLECWKEVKGWKATPAT